MNAQSLIRVAALVLTTALAACSDVEADKQRYLQSGNEFFGQKKYQAAVVEYRNAIALDERFGAAYDSAMPAMPSVTTFERPTCCQTTTKSS